MSWPVVLSEDETLDRVLEGASLARFGDGEFNLALGGKCITQDFVPPIGASLRTLLKYSGKKLLVCIPRQAIGPKASFWSNYMKSEITNLLRAKEYGSSFITRPDSAPWIDRKEYWYKIRRLWENKDVTLVRGSSKSLTKEMLVEAKSVKEIFCPSKNAYQDYGYIRQKIKDDPIILLCLGPTATLLAADLSIQEGIQAIDLGHVGMFLRKHDRGENMIVTEADKAFDRIGYERQGTSFDPNESSYELQGRNKC